MKMARLLDPPVDLGRFEAYGLDCRGAETIEYDRGEVIYPPGKRPQKLFLVDQGFMEIFTLAEDGTASPVSIVPPGDPCGVEHVLGTESHRCSAYALTPCRLHTLPPENLEQALRSGPKAAHWLMHALARRLRQAEEFTAIRSDPHVRPRLIGLLLLLAREFGRDTPEGGITIPLPLTHEEIARLISVTRATATRHFDELKQAGLIRTVKKQVTIPDLARLAEEDTT